MKKSQVKLQKKKNYNFLLKPLRERSQYRLTKVDFTPMQKYQVNINNTQLSVIPSYLLDNNYFTKSFILPVQKRKYLNRLEATKKQFQERIQQELDSNRSIYKQISLGQIKYCYVCKRYYNKYQDHIRLKYHIKNLIRGNKIIQILCEQFKQRLQKQRAQAVQQQHQNQIQKKEIQIQNKPNCES